MDRNLDGVYFRVKRNKEWQNVCFSDLTREEKEDVCRDRSVEWLKELAFVMADTIKSIGDYFDLIGGDSTEEGTEIN